MTWLKHDTIYVGSLERASISQICKILGFHGDDYEEWRLLGCYAVWIL
jgi:hypothetical protein